MSETKFLLMLKVMSKKNAEIRQLRELVEAGMEDRAAIDELVAENLRLRGVLEKVLASHFDERLPMSLFTEVASVVAKVSSGESEV